MRAARADAAVQRDVRADRASARGRRRQAEPRSAAEHLPSRGDRPAGGHVQVGAAGGGPDGPVHLRTALDGAVGERDAPAGAQPQPGAGDGGVEPRPDVETGVRGLGPLVVAQRPVEVEGEHRGRLRGVPGRGSRAAASGRGAGLPGRLPAGPRRGLRGSLARPACPRSARRTSRCAGRSAGRPSCHRPSRSGSCGRPSRRHRATSPSRGPRGGRPRGPYSARA